MKGERNKKHKSRERERERTSKKVFPVAGAIPENWDNLTEDPLKDWMIKEKKEEKKERKNKKTNRERNTSKAFLTRSGRCKIVKTMGLKNKPSCFQFFMVSPLNLR